MKPSTRGPIAVVEPASQRIQIEAGATKARASFKIHNRGDSELVLGELHTSCGCVVASIGPRNVAPGAFATVEIEGQRGPVGDRAVQLEVETNQPGQPLAVMPLVVTADVTLPGLGTTLLGLNLGVVREPGASEQRSFRTHEVQGSEPWVVRAVSTRPEIEVETRLESEQAVGGGVVDRTYALTARLAALPEERGPITSEIRVIGRDQEEPILRFPASCIRQAAVAASPSALIATVLPGDEPLKLDLVFRASDPDFVLAVVPPEDVPEGLVIEEAGHEPGWRRFEVRPVQRVPERIEATLRFRTNHPEAAQVEVPVRLRFEAS